MNSIQEIKKGDVLLVNFDGFQGHEQQGKRYCIVVSNDSANRHGPCITVVPCTTSKTKHRIPTHTVLMLREKSIVLCECITTIDKSRIIEPKGYNIGVGNLRKVMKCVKIALGI